MPGNRQSRPPCRACCHSAIGKDKLFDMGPVVGAWCFEVLILGCNERDCLLASCSKRLHVRGEILHVETRPDCRLVLHEAQIPVREVVAIQPFDWAHATHCVCANTLLLVVVRRTARAALGSSASRSSGVCRTAGFAAASSLTSSHGSSMRPLGIQARVSLLPSEDKRKAPLVANATMRSEIFLL